MYDFIIFLSYHENSECLKDLILNIQKFNKNVFIIISDGNNNENTNIDEFKNVYIFKRSIKINNVFDTRIAMHIEMYDKMLELNIKSNKILLMTSNQMFIKSGLFEKSLKYKFSYWERLNLYDMNVYCQNPLFNKCYNDLGKEHFKYHTSLDGAFYDYEIFCNLIKYFYEYKNTSFPDHQEDFLYVAFLSKYYNLDLDGLQFKYYNIYNIFTNIEYSQQDILDYIEKDVFLLKRINRIYNDPARVFIRNLQ